jgi:hypothetical protein
MPKIYTANDLISFIYNETSTEQSIHVEHLLKHNVKAKEEFDVLKETIDMLDAESLDPHPTSLKIIMEHSAKNAKELI